jgi:hypothetical protein
MKDRHKNLDLRRQAQIPCPEIEVVENSLRELIHTEDWLIKTLQRPIL